MTGDDDLITVLAKFRVGMQRLNLPVPEIILFKSYEDGHRILHELHQKNVMKFTIGDGGYGKPVEHPDGSVWMEIEVYGLKLRWPANRLALESGGYTWV